MYAHSNPTPSSTTAALKRALKSIALGITCVALVFSTAEAKYWKLPKCRKDHQPQHLQIITKVNRGWTVNGLPAVSRSDGAWANVAPSHWIGPSSDQVGTYTYVVPFFAPGPHLSMQVTATWAADNCGVSLQGGTGTPVNPEPSGSCYSGGYDFMYAWTTPTPAQFATADLNNPNPTLTFVTQNQGSVTGLTGIFDIVAECK